MDILLVDDHTATREELASLIEEQDDLVVVGQAADGKDGVRLAKELHPDIILMDVVMPGMNGIAATKLIRDSVPEARVLVLSNHTGKSLVNELIRVGANGYVRKDRIFEELLPAIKTVAKNKCYIGEHVSD